MKEARVGQERKRLGREEKKKGKACKKKGKYRWAVEWVKGGEVWAVH